jgi:CBS domain-containing protein
MRHVVFCHECASIGEAASFMARARVRRLPVVARDRELVGIVSLADMARIADAGRNIAAVVARVISEPMGAAKTPAGERSHRRSSARVANRRFARVRAQTARSPTLGAD